jgi:hypothetical protein
MPGCNSQRRGTFRTSQFFFFLLLCMFHSLYSLYCFLCKCVMYCCHRVSTQLKLKIEYYYYYLLSLVSLESLYIFIEFGRTFWYTPLACAPGSRRKSFRRVFNLKAFKRFKFRHGRLSYISYLAKSIVFRIREEEETSIERKKVK